MRQVVFNNPFNQLVSCSDDKSIKIWSLESCKFTNSLLGHSNWVKTCCTSPNGQLIASGSDDKSVKLWDHRLKNCTRTWEQHSSSVGGVVFHPSNNNVLASCSLDKSINIYDLRTNQLVQHYKNTHSSTL